MKSNSQLSVRTIGPTSWQVVVRGKDGAEQVRRQLQEMGVDCSKAKEECLRFDPPTFAFTATAEMALAGE